MDVAEARAAPPRIPRLHQYVAEELRCLTDNGFEQGEVLGPGCAGLDRRERERRYEEALEEVIAGRNPPGGTIVERALRRMARAPAADIVTAELAPTKVSGWPPP